MGILLICEAPDCFKTIPPEIKQGRPSAPEGWWMLAKVDRFIVACCERHLVAIQKREARAKAA